MLPTSPVGRCDSFTSNISQKQSTSYFNGGQEAEGATVGEPYYVWVKTALKSLEILFCNNRTAHSYSLILIDVV